MAYISGNLLCKVGLTETKKIFSYGWTEDKDLKPENQGKLPKDYTQWYKKVKENFWVKKWGKKEDYFTKGEILKREAKKEGKSWGSDMLGDFLSWLSSKGLSEEEAKKVDYYHYARHVYLSTALFLILSWILFYIVHSLVLTILLHLLWKEPRLDEN